VQDVQAQTPQQPCWTCLVGVLQNKFFMALSAAAVQCCCYVMTEGYDAITVFVVQSVLLIAEAISVHLMVVFVEMAGRSV
jgi:hypothetical protein